MRPMLIAHEGKVQPVSFPDEVNELFNEPFLVQMLMMEPTAVSFMAYASEQKKNGYSRDDLLKFADENLRDDEFIMYLPILGRVQFTPKKKYDPALDVERSLDILLDSGLFTEKYVTINGVSENRYFLMPELAKTMKALKEPFFRKITLYDFPEVAEEIDKMVRMGDYPGAGNN